MRAVMSPDSPAKKSYFRLLQASYLRAKKLADEMAEHPERYSSERIRETLAYLAHLQKEMAQYHLKDENL